jgi:two-component system chemotaxis sensor kinase CheA
VETAEAPGMQVRPISSRLMQMIDRYVPSDYLTGDPDVLRRARLCLVFVAIFQTQVVVFCVAYYLLGVPQITRLLALGGVLFFLTPRLLARSLDLAVHYSVAIVYLVLLIIAVFTGGPFAPAMWWMVSVPVMATMLAGVRAGGIWFGAVLLTAVVTTTMTASGFVWPQGITGLRKIILEGLALGTLAFVLIGLAGMYESTKQRMLSVLDRANRDMRLVLDNVSQGFMVVDRHGAISTQRSAGLDLWFGAPAADETLWAWIGRSEKSFGQSLELGWEALFDDVLPLELALEQMPGLLVHGGRSYRVEYQPILASATVVDSVVVVVTDVTAQIEAERAEVAERELMAVLGRIHRDRPGFIIFWEDACSIIERLRSGAPHALRDVHTLKGNCGFFGAASVARQCHALESTVLDTGDESIPAEIERLTVVWDRFAARIAPLLRLDTSRLDVAVADYTDLVNATRRRVNHPELEAMLHGWHDQRTEESFARVAEQAQSLALRLEKGPLQIPIEHGNVRLDPARWSPVWSAFVHAVRNAVDHGIETPEERVAAGKDVPARIELRSRLDGDDVVIEIADDGRGIQWDRVAERAAQAGLAHTTREDLENALFSEGFTSKEDVTDVSGRGVGLAALRSACESLGGTVTLASVDGKGTCLRVRAPLHARANKGRWSSRPAPPRRGASLTV